MNKLYILPDRYYKSNQEYRYIIYYLSFDFTRKILKLF